MSKNNEIVAVQLSGISLFRLAVPALIFGILISLTTFYIQEQISPSANLKARETLNIIRNIKNPTHLEYNKNWVNSPEKTIFFYNF